MASGWHRWSAHGPKTTTLPLLRKTLPPRGSLYNPGRNWKFKGPVFRLTFLLPLLNFNCNFDSLLVYFHPGYFFFPIERNDIMTAMESFIKISTPTPEKSNLICKSKYHSCFFFLFKMLSKQIICFGFYVEPEPAVLVMLPRSCLGYLVSRAPL